MKDKLHQDVEASQQKSNCTCGEDCKCTPENHCGCLDQDQACTCKHEGECTCEDCDCQDCDCEDCQCDGNCECGDDCQCTEEEHCGCKDKTKSKKSCKCKSGEECDCGEDCKCKSKKTKAEKSCGCGGKHHHHHHHHHHDHHHHDHQNIQAPVEAKASEAKIAKVSELLALLTNPTPELLQDAQENAEEYMHLVFDDMLFNRVDPEFFVHIPAKCSCGDHCNCTPAYHCGCYHDQRLHLVALFEKMLMNQGKNDSATFTDDEYGLFKVGLGNEDHNHSCGCGEHHEHDSDILMPLIALNPKALEELDARGLAGIPKFDWLPAYSAEIKGFLEKISPDSKVYEVYGVLWGLVVTGDLSQLDQALYLFFNYDKDKSLDQKFKAKLERFIEFAKDYFIHEEFWVEDLLAHALGKKLTALQALTHICEFIDGFTIGAALSITNSKDYTKDVILKAQDFLNELTFYKHSIMQVISEVMYEVSSTTDETERSRLAHELDFPGHEEFDLERQIGLEIAARSGRKTTGDSSEVNLNTIFQLPISG